MLRPNKGEGERPAPSTKTNNKDSNKDKRPLAKAVICPTVVFLAVSPILLATQATSAYALDGTSQQQLQTQQQKGLAFLRQPQPKMNQGLGTRIFPFLQSPLDELNAKLASLRTTLAQAQTKLNQAQQTKSAAQTALSAAQAKAQSANQELSTAKSTLNSATSALEAAKTQVSTAQSALQVAEAALMQQTQTTDTAQSDLEAAQANLLTATSNLQTAQSNYEQASQRLTAKIRLKAASEDTLSTAQATMQQALSTFNAKRALSQDAYQAILSAQAAYDASQIPNPAYVPPSYTTQPTQYQIPDANFQTGAPWTGDGTAAGEPVIHPGHLHYSYTGTEVYQDIAIAPREIANYVFTVSVWNQDQNTTGYVGQTPDTYGLRIYFYDADDNLIHQNSVTSSEVHPWRDVVLQGDTGTTIPVSKVRIAVYGIDNGYWSGTYGPAMNNVRLTLGWITGTTQNPEVTGTMSVDIGEGGQSTYTAPNGGIFTAADLAYVSYNDYNCGALVDASQFLGSSTITLDANNAVWGDTCGGQVKHLVGTLTYSYAQPQYIKDPALLQAVQAAQTAYDTVYRPEEVAAYVVYLDALNAYNAANQSDQTLDAEIATLTTSAQTAQAQTATVQAALDVAQEELDDAQDVADAEEAALTSTQSTKDSAVATLTTAQATLAAATSTQAEAQSNLTTAESNLTTATTSTQSAELTLTTAAASLVAAESEVKATSTQIEAVELEIKNTPEPTPTPTPTPTPEPEPEPEEEIKVELPPLDDLTKVNFEEITPTDLTQAQAEEIKQAALETFETAQQGSPEYEAALTALLVAAQADDIVVDPALAEIPGLGQAAEAAAAVLNLLSNVGADISPQVREKAQQATVAAVIVGQVAQAAVAATATASITRRP